MPAHALTCPCICAKTYAYTSDPQQWQPGSPARWCSHAQCSRAGFVVVAGHPCPAMARRRALLDPHW
eukprot:10160201-Alexandrium_andersonii.AAC.1